MYPSRICKELHETDENGGSQKFTWSIPYITSVEKVVDTAGHTVPYVNLSVVIPYKAKFLPFKSCWVEYISISTEMTLEAFSNSWWGLLGYRPWTTWQIYRCFSPMAIHRRKLTHHVFAYHVQARKYFPFVNPTIHDTSIEHRNII